MLYIIQVKYYQVIIDAGKREYIMCKTKYIPV